MHCTCAQGIFESNWENNRIQVFTWSCLPLSIGLDKRYLHEGFSIRLSRQIGLLSNYLVAYKRSHCSLFRFNESSILYRFKQAQANHELSQTCFHSMCNTVFLLQLQRRGSRMSTLSSIGRLGHYEVRGLLLCFLHIAKNLSEGQYQLFYLCA